MQEEEAELHGRAAPRRTLGVHSRGHSRAGSVASNASNASNASVNSAGSVLSPQSAQHDDLLDEHDLLDDIDVDTSFDDVTAATEQTEVNSAPPTLDEGQEEEAEPSGRPEEQQLAGGADDEFAATDDAFEIDPVADNNLIETPVKPAEQYEEKTQDAHHSSQQLVADTDAQEADTTQASRQTVIITAPQSAAQERRQSNVHKLSATPEPELEEKEDNNAHKDTAKPAVQPAVEAHVVEAPGSSSNTLALDGTNAVMINTGSSHGIQVRKASLSQGSDVAPVTLDLVIGSTSGGADGQADEDEYEEDEDEYEDEEEDNGPAVPIVLSLNITIGSNGQILQQSIQPVTEAAPVVASHDTAKIELITNEQAAADKQHEEAKQAEQATTQAETKRMSAPVVVEAQPAQQAAQFTTIIIDRDTTGSYETTASPFTRTPAGTVTEQPKQHEEDTPMDTTLLPTRTPAPSTAVPADAVASDATSIVIESPAAAIPSTMTYYDTLTTSRDQPSVSTLEPVIRAPAPSTALPAGAIHTDGAAHVVKSVAFSDEVIALGEGKEERSESLDFGDDFSLPTTPLRGSIIDHTATTASSHPQPIASSTVSQADNTTAMASINRLKQLEAERRADEDKRKADEVDAKRQSIESERAAEVQRAEQQHAAEDKVREQLAESKRALFAQMREGVPVTKLGKKGSPRDTRIFITEAEGQEGSYTINWDSKSKKANDAKMPLTDCRCVVGGDEGMFVHRKYAGKYDGVSERCVSVVSAVRGLDVVLADEEAVNRLVAMLRLCGCPVRES